jgi:DNA-binding GntR family transcriptional regulator
MLRPLVAKTERVRATAGAAATPAARRGKTGSKITKKDVVAATIRNEIAQGRLRAGMKLRQYDVAARLGVSATPVREAFGVLALEGLVEWDAYRGVSVARDLRGTLTLAGLYELRGAVETLAVRIGGKSPDPRVLRILEEAEVEAREADRAGDVGRWRLANLRFHSGIVELAKSDLLNQLMGIVLRASMFFPRTQSMRVHREHSAILAALKAGQAHAALRFVASHAKANVETARAEQDGRSRVAPGPVVLDPRGRRLRSAAPTRRSARRALTAQTSALDS